MADKTIHALDEISSVANDDEIGIWDLTAGQYMRITRVNLVSGAIAAALTSAANVFTAAQVVDLAADGFPLTCKRAGVSVASIYADGGFAKLSIDSRDNGSTVGGHVEIGRNSNGSTPAPGHVLMSQADGSYSTLFPDNSGVWRTLDADQPINSNFASATVVGAQTSMAEAKHIESELSPLPEVLVRIAQGAEAVRRFVYKSGAFNNEQFEGVVTDLAPAYGYDRDPAHPQGKALNEIQVVGDLLRAVAWLAERVRELERQ